MRLNVELYLYLIRRGTARLGRNRQAVNDLNVFPIPDGDTGDNMYMTMEAGCSGRGASLGEAAEAVSKGMLLGARGNSGVILSRIFAGLAKGFHGLDDADAKQFAEAVKSGVAEAYRAVPHPVEGTMLTVLREGADAAAAASGLEEYFELWTAGMEESLRHTPELLDVLRRAGVVDSGGAGLLCIAEGMRDGLREASDRAGGDNGGDGYGRREQPDQAGGDEESDGYGWREHHDRAGGDEMGAGRASVTAPDISAFTEDSVLEFGYCTEFLLRLQNSKVDLQNFDENIIRNYLEQRGDSLVFFRDGSIVKVHVHTMDPGAVLTKCREWGEFLTIKVENMTLQHHGNHMEERFKPFRKSVGVVTVACGEGLVRTFREMGADAVIEGGQTMNPPVERFLEAFDKVGAETILVFPNNGNILLTARQAAEIYDKSHIIVIPTKTIGEGYYSMANLDTSLPETEMVTALEEAAAAVTTGLISRAIRDCEEYRKDDYLGLDGKTVLCGDPIRARALEELAAKLGTGAHDIAVLFYGAGVPADEAESAKAALEKAFPMTEAILIDGGQAVYDYILVLC